MNDSFSVPGQSVSENVHPSSDVYRFCSAGGFWFTNLQPQHHQQPPPETPATIIINQPSMSTLKSRPGRDNRSSDDESDDDDVDSCSVSSRESSSLGTSPKTGDESDVQDNIPRMAKPGETWVFFVLCCVVLCCVVLCCVVLCCVVLCCVCVFVCVCVSLWISLSFAIVCSRSCTCVLCKFESWRSIHP